MHIFPTVRRTRTRNPIPKGALVFWGYFWKDLLSEYRYRLESHRYRAKYNFLRGCRGKTPNFVISKNRPIKVFRLLRPLRIWYSMQMHGLLLIVFRVNGFVSLLHNAFHTVDLSYLDRYNEWFAWSSSDYFGIQISYLVSCRRYK